MSYNQDVVFLCTIKGTLNGLLKQATREDLNELLSTDAGREHFLNRLEIKEMNEIDVVEAVQEAKPLRLKRLCLAASPECGEQPNTRKSASTDVLNRVG